jgi:hypothetical protein
MLNAAMRPCHRQMRASSSRKTGENDASQDLADSTLSPNFRELEDGEVVDLTELAPEGHSIAQDVDDILEADHIPSVRATPSASPPFGTSTLSFAVFGFRFAPEGLWSEPSPMQSPRSLFGGPSFLSPPLVPLFAPCSSRLCMPQCCIGLVPWTPVYFWF